jgi:hypothetical protein
MVEELGLVPVYLAVIGERGNEYCPSIKATTLFSIDFQNCKL